MVMACCLEVETYMHDIRDVDVDACGHLMSDLTKLNLIPSSEAPILAKKTCFLPPLSFSTNTLPCRFDFNFLLVKSDGCYMWANTLTLVLALILYYSFPAKGGAAKYISC